jgi:transmembrane sensor
MSSALAAEAAIWVVKMNGPEKSESVDAAFQEWLRESPAHAAAFAEVSETWDQSTRILRDQYVAQPNTGSFWLNAAAAVVMVAVLVLASSAYYFHRMVRITDIGEFRSFPLEDGSTLTLNTATRVDVKYSGTQRFISLAPGEAKFDVQRNPQKPFVVDTPLAQICSLGTTFAVRSDEARVRVTLVQGKVKVSRKPSSCSLASEETIEGQEIVLKPNEQVVVATGKAMVAVPVNVADVLSWEHRQLRFKSQPLKEVVLEINRYIKKPLVIGDPEIEDEIINGRYIIGSTLEFAQALQHNQRITFREEPDRVVLFKAPEEKPLS